jgi:hypothetical protein
MLERSGGEAAGRGWTARRGRWAAALAALAFVAGCASAGSPKKPDKITQELLNSP